MFVETVGVHGLLREGLASEGRCHGLQQRLRQVCCKVRVDRVHGCGPCPCVELLRWRYSLYCVAYRYSQLQKLDIECWLQNHTTLFNEIMEGKVSQVALSILSTYP